MQEGHPDGCPAKSCHSIVLTRNAVSAPAKRLKSFLETVLRDQDLRRAVYKQAASHVPNIGAWLADTSVAVEVSCLDQAPKKVFGRDAQATRCALQAQTCFVILR